LSGSEFPFPHVLHPAPAYCCPRGLEAIRRREHDRHSPVLSEGYPWSTLSRSRCGPVPKEAEQR